MAPREGGESDDDGECDDGEDHAVLRHGLTVLTPQCNEGLFKTSRSPPFYPSTHVGVLAANAAEMARGRAV